MGILLTIMREEPMQISIFLENGKDCYNPSEVMKGYIEPSEVGYFNN